MNADPAWRGHFTLVVVSEFGRVLYQNDSGGCDHGAGNLLFLIGSGGNVNGGKVYGNWPGLQTMGFNDGLPITTDYRTVLADVLHGRMGATVDQIKTQIFPGLNFGGPLGYTDLGLLSQSSNLGVGKEEWGREEEQSSHSPFPFPLSSVSRSLLGCWPG